MWMLSILGTNNKIHNTKIRSRAMKKCSICKEPIQPDFNGWDGGHNAEPINSGRCCAMCNDMIVIPRRMSEYLERRK